MILIWYKCILPQDVYKNISPTVLGVVQGLNVTVFAYGSTGRYAFTGIVLLLTSRLLSLAIIKYVLPYTHSSEGSHKLLLLKYGVNFISFLFLRKWMIYCPNTSSDVIIELTHYIFLNFLYFGIFCVPCLVSLRVKK